MAVSSSSSPVWLVLLIAALLQLQPTTANHYTYYGYGFPGSAFPVLSEESADYAPGNTFVCSTPSTVTSSTETLRTVGVTWAPQDNNYGSFNSSIQLVAGLYSVDTTNAFTLVAAANHNTAIAFPGYDPSFPNEAAYFYMANFTFTAAFTGQLDPTVNYSACVGASADWALFYDFASIGVTTQADVYDFDSGLLSSFVPNNTDYNTSASVWFETIVSSPTPTNYYGTGFPGDASSVFVTDIGLAGFLFCSNPDTVSSSGETLQAVGVTWDSQDSGDGFFLPNIQVNAGLYTVDAGANYTFTLVAAANQNTTFTFPGYDPTYPTVAGTNISYFTIGNFSFAPSFTGSLDPTVDYSVCIIANNLWTPLSVYGGSFDKYFTVSSIDLPASFIPNAGFYNLFASVWFETATVSTPSVLGDPQFVGLLGQRYQVHGIDGAVYSLISSAAEQVNGRFVFLDSGVCPVIDGKIAADCWSHPGSYIGELSFQQRLVDGVVHRALVSAGSASSGYASVSADGQRLQVGESISLSSAFSVHYTSFHVVAVRAEHFSFQLTNSDHFINQQLTPLVPLRQLRGVHGLLGQTHSRKVYRSAIQYIEGNVDDYCVMSGDMYGSENVYGRFVASVE